MTAEVDRLEGVDGSRTAMVSDTLPTDILGGRAAGLRTVLVRTVLVRDHGLFSGRVVDDCVTASGLVPDFSCPAIWRRAGGPVPHLRALGPPIWQK